MKAIKIIGIIVITIPVFFTGCLNQSVANIPTNDINVQSAMDYLKNFNYKVLSYNGKGEYTLSKEMLTRLPYMQYFGVQRLDSGDYIGKKIETYSVMIKNHPLDKYKGNSKRQTRAWVMVCENRVIGGYSLPDLDLSGGVYSIEGKTLEEVINMDFQKWREKWMEKYK